MRDKTFLLLNSPLERGANSLSYQKQLSQRLKRAILSGQLAAGQKLPSSRTLAIELNVSRNTVQIVYEQLASEGYIVANRQGSRIAELSKGASESLCSKASKTLQHQPYLFSDRTSVAGGGMLPLAPGVPALNKFPFSAWRRCWQNVLSGATPSLLSNGDPLGEMPLRQAIAQYLSVTRGVRCDTSRIIITEGAKSAINLCVKLFTRPGDVAWLEEPGYQGAKAAFSDGNLNLVAIRANSEGIRFPPQVWQAQSPRLIYVTPSHQYPTGTLLPITERLELIKRARECGAWIIEDDYDSEFRHYGAPVAAMQGLQPAAPVLYVGTFSKMMFPALRIGFLVLPEHIAIPAKVNSVFNGGGHRFEQLVLANFIESGQFSRHLKRMRRLYRERQLALRDAIGRYFQMDYRISGGQVGMHLTVYLPSIYPDERIVAEARRNGMNPGRLSDYAMEPCVEDNGLVIGYGNTSTELFIPLIKKLDRIICRASR